MVNVTIDKLEESTITIFAMLCANALMNWTEVLYALKQPQKRHCIIGFSSVRHFTQFYETEFDMLKAKEIFSRFVSSKRWVSKWTNNISGSLFARFESERLRLLREIIDLSVTNASRGEIDWSNMTSYVFNTLDHPRAIQFVEMKGLQSLQESMVVADSNVFDLWLNENILCTALSKAIYQGKPSLTFISNGRDFCLGIASAKWSFRFPRSR